MRRASVLVLAGWLAVTPMITSCSSTSPVAPPTPTPRSTGPPAPPGRTPFEGSGKRPATPSEEPRVLHHRCRSGPPRRIVAGRHLELAVHCVVPVEIGRPTTSG